MYICFSLVKSIVFFYFPVYCVALLSSLLCCSIFHSVLLLYCPTYCVFLLSSVLYRSIAQSLALPYCSVYCVVLLSSLLCLSIELIIVQSISLLYCPVYCYRFGWRWHRCLRFLTYGELPFTKCSFKGHRFFVRRVSSLFFLRIFFPFCV